MYSAIQANTGKFMLPYIPIQKYKPNTIIQTKYKLNTYPNMHWVCIQP